MVTGHKHIKPTVFAVNEALCFRVPLNEIDLKETTGAFLLELAEALKSRGCTLIGHIKGLVASDEKGHLMFSLSSFGEKARFNGKLHHGIMKASFTINIIIYGVDAAIVDAVFHESFRRHFSKIIGG